MTPHLNACAPGTGLMHQLQALCRQSTRSLARHILKVAQATYLSGCALFVSVRSSGQTQIHVISTATRIEPVRLRDGLHRSRSTHHAAGWRPTPGRQGPTDFTEAISDQRPLARWSLINGHWHDGRRHHGDAKKPRLPLPPPGTGRDCAYRGANARQICGPTQQLGLTCAR